MTEKELDREYIGRQANEIKNLEEENKAFNEKKFVWLAVEEEYNDIITEQAMEISGLREIRDKLLEALKEISDRDCFDPPTIDNLIRDAQAIKEKETK